jgi:2'-5' RNA ligase superfamily
LSESAPIIVTALMGDADFAFFNWLRKAHFPPERNQIDAHLTLFHHLPPAIAPELKARLAEATRGPAPAATIAGIISLGGGVAFRIESEGLDAIRDDLKHAFSGLLTPQDSAGWRAHVTVQNKVEPSVARALKTQLEADFTPRPVRIAGLAAWWYRGGPWEPLSRHMFRG